MATNTNLAIAGVVVAGAAVGGVALLGGEEDTASADAGSAVTFEEAAAGPSTPGAEITYRIADFARSDLVGSGGAPSLRTLTGVRGGLVCGVPQATTARAVREVLLDDGEAIALRGIAPPALDEEGAPLRRCYVLREPGEAGAEALAPGEYGVRREGPTP